MALTDGQTTGATPRPVELEPTPENIAAATEAARASYEQVTYLDAKIRKMHQEMDAYRDTARTYWEWALTHSPTPDYTHDRAALLELVRCASSYGSNSVGRGVLRDWIASFGSEFHLGSMGANQGPKAHLPSVTIRMLKDTDPDALAASVLALTDATKPQVGPVIFEINVASSDDRWFLFGPDDENYEEWTIRRGDWDGDAKFVAAGDLGRVLRYAATFL